MDSSLSMQIVEGTITELLKFIMLHQITLGLLKMITLTRENIGSIYSTLETFIIISEELQVLSRKYTLKMLCNIFFIIINFDLQLIDKPFIGG